MMQPPVQRYLLMRGQIAKSVIMDDRPAYLSPLTRPDMTLDAAFAACVDTFNDHPIPSHLCRQCFEPQWEQQIIAAAREIHAGKAPHPRDYGQIYFEHPTCSGGEDTIKLFTPFGLRDLLTGQMATEETNHGSWEVIEKLVQAGFWWWPADQQEAVRNAALCLFWDWFEHGRYAWPATDRMKAEPLGPGDDILLLCSLCLVDPLDIVRVLSGLHTPQADVALAGPLNFSVSECTYVSCETSADTKHYQAATATIAETLKTREAMGFITFVTKSWVDAAYFRNDIHAPSIAKELSEFGKHYDIRMLEACEAIKVPMLETWPALDLIR